MAAGAGQALPGLRDAQPETGRRSGCVEVGIWRKSGYSGGNGGDCVEVISTAGVLIAVRDSKNPNGPKLAFTPSGWQQFIQQVRNTAINAD